ncbi:MAG TPA: RidA family protein [Streptosporangiaceae bacterium]|jgi:2-iminobutanoate/2-iminopropanoate deaminase
MAAELSRHLVAGLRPPSGAYVHAVVHGGLVYCSGQVGVDPASGAVADGVGPQTRQALANLEAVLAAVGSDLSRVVKATVYIRDAEMFTRMDAVFADAFGSARTARTTIPGVNFRAGVDVEIDLVAAVG